MGFEEKAHGKEEPIEGYIYDNVAETVQEQSSGKILLAWSRVESHLAQSQRNRILTASISDTTHPVTPSICFDSAIPNGIRTLNVISHKVNKPHYDCIYP
jgi:hypothetical protein